MKFEVIILLICILAFALGYRSQSRVKISEGELGGTTYTLPNGRELQAFLGIPYAAAPIGDNRFEEPKPPLPWKGIREATSVGKICLQASTWNCKEGNRENIEVVGDEDCLFLNVFTPKLPNDPNKEEDLMNVLFYIHGGGFVFGSSSDAYPDYILQEANIVFVSINYRLGPLGFFSIGNPLAPGNNGLKDQAEALRWVQRNIRYFGGNPAKVTIYGISAGGASVHFQMISPLTRGLFQSAISSSGTTSLPWSLQDTVVKTSIELAAAIGCKHKNAFALMKCLKSKSIDDIVIEGYAKYYKDNYLIDFRFAPVIEPSHAKAFLSENPYELMKSSKIKHIPWMISVAENEGALFGFDAIENKTKTRQINNQWDEIAPVIFKFNDLPSEYERDNISASIRKYYLANKPLSEKTAKHFFQAIGDRHFYNGIIDTAKLYAAASSGNTFCYKFYYRGAESYLNVLSESKKNYGSLHVEDALYVIKILDGKSKTDNDMEIMKLLTSSIITFMETGNPNIPELQVEWEPLSGDGIMKCLGIYSYTCQRMEDIENHKTTQFWNNLLPPEKYRKCDLSGRCKN